MPDERKPFAAFLQEQRRGALHGELSDSLQALVQAVAEHGKAGSLTLTTGIKPNADGRHHDRLLRGQGEGAGAGSGAPRSSSPTPMATSSGTIRGSWRSRSARFRARSRKRRSGNERQTDAQPVRRGSGGRPARWNRPAGRHRRRPAQRRAEGARPTSRRRSIVIPRRGRGLRARFERVAQRPRSSHGQLQTCDRRSVHRRLEALRRGQRQRYGFTPPRAASKPSTTTTPAIARLPAGTAPSSSSQPDA